MTKPLELDLRELLAFEPEGSLIHFAGHRELSGWPRSTASSSSTGPRRRRTEILVNACL